MEDAPSALRVMVTIPYGTNGHGCQHKACRINGKAGKKRLNLSSPLW
jgi:hypothetical protein